MYTTFMNSENNNACDLRRLIVKPSDKISYIFIFLKTFNLEFPYVEVWFTDQKSKPLETEDKINITLVIN